MSKQIAVHNNKNNKKPGYAHLVESGPDNLTWWMQQYFKYEVSSPGNFPFFLLFFNFFATDVHGYHEFSQVNNYLLFYNDNDDSRYSIFPFGIFPDPFETLIHPFGFDPSVLDIDPSVRSFLPSVLDFDSSVPGVDPFVRGFLSSVLDLYPSVRMLAVYIQIHFPLYKKGPLRIKQGAF